MYSRFKYTKILSFDKINVNSFDYIVNLADIHEFTRILALGCELVKIIMDLNED
jgi:hypothetical protein